VDPRSIIVHCKNNEKHQTGLQTVGGQNPFQTPKNDSSVLKFVNGQDPALCFLWTFDTCTHPIVPMQFGVRSHQQTGVRPDINSWGNLGRPFLIPWVRWTFLCLIGG